MTFSASRLLGFSCVRHGAGRPGARPGRSTPRATNLALVEGIDNLAQALTVALTTPLGGDVFNVDFGFDGLNAIAEETVPVLVQERIRIAMVTLLQEGPARAAHRRRDSSRTGGSTNPGAGARELDVSVVFETVSGDTATLDLGKVKSPMADCDHRDRGHPGDRRGAGPHHRRAGLRPDRRRVRAQAVRAPAGGEAGAGTHDLRRRRRPHLGLGHPQDPRGHRAGRRAHLGCARRDVRQPVRLLGARRGAEPAGRGARPAAAVPAGARHDPPHARRCRTGSTSCSIPRGARLFTRRQPPRGHHRERGPDPRPAGPRTSPWRRSIPGPSTTSTPTSPRRGGNPQKIAFWNRDDTKLARVERTPPAPAPLESVVGDRAHPPADRRRAALAGHPLPRRCCCAPRARPGRSRRSASRHRWCRACAAWWCATAADSTSTCRSSAPSTSSSGVFGAERDIVSPNFFTVLVALTDAAIFEGPDGVRASVESVIEDLRPIGIYPRVQEAHRVFAGIAADLVVTGIPLPRTSTGVVNDSDAAKNFKRALLDRVQRYVDTLDFGEPVRFSEVTFALMSEPGLADVRNLRLLRSPPRLGEVKELGGRIFSELPLRREPDRGRERDRHVCRRLRADEDRLAATQEGVSMATYDASVKKALAVLSAGPHRPQGALLGRPARSSRRSGVRSDIRSGSSATTLSTRCTRSARSARRPGQHRPHGRDRPEAARHERRIQRHARFAGATSHLHRRRGRGQQRVRRAAARMTARIPGSSSSHRTGEISSASPTSRPSASRRASQPRGSARGGARASSAGGGASDRWHITATDIHEASFPRLNSVISRGFTHAVAFHGFDDPRTR